MIYNNKKSNFQIKRAQVWFINDESMNITMGSELRKSRPWLIVSNDTNNYFSRVIQVVPLTTSTKKNSKYHVSFYDKFGTAQTVECEQIQTKSIQRLKLLNSRYLYTLSDEIMEQVDKALLVQLGLEQYSTGIYYEDQTNL